MASINNHASQSEKAYRDFTQTPREVFAGFDAVYNYDVDGAALPISALCERYYTPQMDSLSIDWSSDLIVFDAPAAVWLNPPYSDILPWVEKCHEQRQKGVLSTLFIPRDNRTEWYFAARETASAIIDITGYYELITYKSGPLKGQVRKKWRSGGINFINAATGQANENELNKPMCLVEFDPRKSGKCKDRTITKQALLKRGVRHLKKQG
jgi:phage N-6-adenine-methyltransferase